SHRALDPAAAWRRPIRCSRLHRSPTASSTPSIRFLDVAHVRGRYNRRVWAAGLGEPSLDPDRPAVDTPATKIEAPELIPRARFSVRGILHHSLPARLSESRAKAGEI